jgi:hypothetical protein
MKRSFLVPAGITVLVAILVAAAFVGGRVINGQGVAPTIVGKGPVAYSAEMPAGQPDLYGVFLRRDNSTIIICLPANAGPTIDLTISADGTVSEGTNGCSGPEVQVVVAGSTKVYHDITAQQYATHPMVPGETIQQKVEPGSLDDTSSATRLLVWGERRGDRLVADVLVYWVPSGGRKVGG